LVATALTPSQRYADGVVFGHWQSDPAQLAALGEFDRIQRELIAATPDSAWGKLTARFREAEAVRGLYLWGGVGRGKTFLTDLLYDSAPVPKRRWHFHRFMGEVHARLRALPDTADTLAVVAKDLARDLRLLVLDEFFVGDIGDAMILGRLLDQLIARGVTLVTTSNLPPRELYRDGLQRASFLPAIDLLEKHCAVLKLESAQDYRLRQLRQASTYHTPLGEGSEAALSAQFDRLAGPTSRESGPLRINERDIAVKALAEGLVWFEFAALCDGPRAAADYIEIARDFHTVFVSNVPRFDRGDEDPARRFVHFVDEIYDRHVNLLLSAAADPLSLYQGDRLEREFERTSSRLIEMQSAEYLALEHRP
jgi:cell division protein ZapE